MKNKVRTGILLALLVTGIAVVSANAAGNSGSTKPGNGFGDKNHIHTGPPGQSNRP